MMQPTSESGLDGALDKLRPLCGQRVALLEGEGLNAERLSTLLAAFELAGAEVVLVAPMAEIPQSGKGAAVVVDARLQDTAPEVFHALCIPGAASAVAALRSSPEALEFVRSFVESGKWIATLDNGPLLLEDAGVLAGRTVTSARQARAELERGGANWVAEAVIADDQIVTAQGDAQLEAFLRVVTSSFREKRRGPPPGFH